MFRVFTGVLILADNAMLIKIISVLLLCAHNAELCKLCIMLSVNSKHRGRSGLNRRSRGVSVYMVAQKRGLKRLNQFRDG